MIGPAPFLYKMSFPNFRKATKAQFAFIKAAAKAAKVIHRRVEVMFDIDRGLVLMHRYPFGTKLRAAGDTVRLCQSKLEVVSCKLDRKKPVTVVTVVDTKGKKHPDPPTAITSRRRSPYIGETVLVVFKDTSSDAGTKEDGTYTGFGAYAGPAGVMDGAPHCWVRTEMKEPLCLFPCSCVYDSRFLVWL